MAAARVQCMSVMAQDNPLEALRESEERYRRLVELSPEAIFVHDGERILYSNAGGADLLGAVQPEVLFGRPILELIHPNDQSIVKARIDKIYQSREIGRTELQLLRLDGRSIDVEAVTTPITYDGEPAVLALVHDITDHKRIEADLAQRVRELSRTNAELEQFAYVASHDLQEPLRKVLSFSELLARSLAGRLDAEAEAYMRYITDGATRMQGLVRDLLTYVRVGKDVGTLRPTDMAQVLNTTLTELDTPIRQKRAVITHDPLPYVLSQPTLMKQLLNQLLANALTFHGSESPCVHIAVEPREQAWQFAVRDNGIGVEPEYAERIFLIFQRLHARDTYPGTGIGLAICQKIVERHCGQIWVESESGEGATFYFTLPAAGSR
ncbi:MAG: ATP-binding protein [Candidatus Tectomicrobia bacterium]|nr:ATP-binding protein [Candidatus Tectomicrobia bacterium]